MTANTTANPAGGRATEAGMTFQGGVGLWLSAQAIAAMPVGSRFGVHRDAAVTKLRFETGENLDDVEAVLSGGQRVGIQCKTNIALSGADNSDLSKVLGQVVGLRVSAGTNTGDVVGVLALPHSASRSLDDLQAACRQFDSNASWSDIFPRVGQKQQDALTKFRHHVSRAWHARTAQDISEIELAVIARMFCIQRFDVDVGGADWSSAAAAIGTRLFGDAARGERVLPDLEKIVRRFTRSGASADRDGLLRLLRQAGHEETLSPNFDNDIRQLNSWTNHELDRLVRHESISQQGGERVPIPRDCMDELNAAAASGSLFIVGDPGAGKTGVLVGLARRIQSVGQPLVFMSVDDLAEVRDQEGLRSALGLSQPLLKVLAAWPGSAPGTLVIDALDASRGGTSEGVFARLMEDVLSQLGERWVVTASIRTFDLKSGRRFRDLMEGQPPSDAYSEPGLERLRHFRIPELSSRELERLSQMSEPMGRLLASASADVRALLRNVFNLSLAADLLTGGVAPEAIQTLTTQSALIRRYEDERLPGHSQQVATQAVVRSMVEQQRLAIKKVSVVHAGLEDVMSTGVLVPAPNDQVAFAHHVLFDHAAGRFYLDLASADSLRQQLGQASGAGFLLGPALRFALRDLWEQGLEGKNSAWKLLLEFLAADAVDPVISSVALRTVADAVRHQADMTYLYAVASRNRSASVSNVLSRLARFMRVGRIGAQRSDDETQIAWAGLASAAICGEHADAAHVLLFTLFEGGAFHNSDFLAAFGAAGRDFLALSLSDRKFERLVSSGIRFVAKSFSAEPSASRALLNQILSEPRFSLRASEETPWLAEGVPSIVGSDPEFVEQIYSILFGRPAPQNGESLLGNSRILVLKSNQRQDYEHGRWRLQEALPLVLKASPDHGTRAVNACAIAAGTERYGASTEDADQLRLADGRSMSVIDDKLSMEEWRGGSKNQRTNEAQCLDEFTKFLTSCSQEEFAKSVKAALTAEVVSSSVLARLFGVSGSRAAEAADMLWPIASASGTLDIIGLSRDAIEFLAIALPLQSLENRKTFESKVVTATQDSDERIAKAWIHRAARLLSLIPADSIATTELRQLRDKLTAEDMLVGNRPYLSISTSWGDGEPSVVKSILRSHGVDPEKGVEAKLLVSTKPLDALAKVPPAQLTIEQVTEMWELVRAAVAELDQAEQQAHAEALRATWGSVSNALERIVEAEVFVPASTSYPPLTLLLELLDRMAQSPFPEGSSDNDGGGLGWGNWDVRVYVASCYMTLARKCWDSSFRTRLSWALGDRSATVRLQVAQNLNCLWDVAREEMWSLIEQVSLNETHPEVLGFFMYGPIARIVSAEPDRCAVILERICNRIGEVSDEGAKRRRNHFAEAAAAVAGRLWVAEGNQRARQITEQWLSDIVGSDDYVWSLVSGLRHALFLRFKASANEREQHVQLRARELLASVVDRGLALIVNTQLTADDDASSTAAERIRVGARQVEHACNQLYFGSGASRIKTDGDPQGLLSKKDKAAFLDEYGAVLVQIGKAGFPAIIYHLADIYEYLAEADPGQVFDAVSELLIGPGAAHGYQFESLASDALVRLIRRYLADFRSTFEDTKRRSSLVRVLELFASAGDPAALKLLYELPDLLR